MFIHSGGRAVAQIFQRPLHVAIIDEVDSILIDDSRTSLRINGVPNEKNWDNLRWRIVAANEVTNSQDGAPCAICEHAWYCA